MRCIGSRAYTYRKRRGVEEVNTLGIFPACGGGYVLGATRKSNPLSPFIGALVARGNNRNRILMYKKT